ncbi:ATP-binding protein [Lactonifactor longoviformis]|uniref:AAA domain-containing protein n=1 Tax=Lactonifactor longoviformis DSM 17459 TaxID=1122155 RepID=A0A1M5CDK1_9CLOT|nr:ATP-binding protein [Lactonifactor longoviformis]SHF52823.1 AAA domain-containing protein [Lactonifactor longoviformis DSM 17459]
MIIEHLWIKNFGKLHNRELDFGEGITVIFGENESGKSTLHTFIQGIFFGIRRMRGRAARNDVYSRFEPWENSSYYAGGIRFSCGGKTFRLTRNFSKESQRAELICEDDGELLSVEDGDLGILLGNISQVVYDNTVSVGQLKNQTGEGIVAELRNYMSNYQSDTEGQIDIEKAVAALKEKKREFDQARKEELRKQEELLNGLKGKLLFLEEERAELEAKISEAETRREGLRQGEGKADKKDRPLFLRAEHRGSMAVLLAGAVVIFLSILLLPGMIGEVTGTAAGLATIGFLFRFLKKSSRNPKEKHNAPEEEGEIQEEEKKLDWKLEHLREEAEEKDTFCENLKEEYRELLAKHSGEMTPLQEEIEGIDLAIATIQELSRTMQSKIGNRLKNQTSKILGQLTGGRYTQISISDEFRIHLNTGEHYTPLEQLSRGTIEQVYFALRMAVSDILCREEELPVLLDEPFVMYDSRRLQNTLKWLSENKQQVLIFTCQEREIEALEALGLEYHLVRL